MQIPPSPGNPICMNCLLKRYVYKAYTIRRPSFQRLSLFRLNFISKKSQHTTQEHKNFSRAPPIMSQSNYDDSGLVSSYLLLTITLPLTAYQFYRTWYACRSFGCRCKNCKSSRQKHPYNRILVTALLILFLSYLLHNIFTIKVAGKQREFCSADY